MTRREQIEQAADNECGHHEEVDPFIRGAEYADAHPNMETLRLMFRESIEKFEQTEQQLNLAVEALTKVSNGFFEDNKPWSIEVAQEALKKIEELK